MQVIDGKSIAQQLRNELAEEVALMKSRAQRPPHIAVILVGDNPASHTYVNAKIKACNEVGYESTLLEFPASMTQKALISEIDALNSNPEIDGFIVQMPLPSHIDDRSVIQRISPDKDVDGFHPTNVGRMATGLEAFISATPGGIVELLKRYRIETDGKHCVILGRSNIVGGPMAMLMRQNRYPGNCTVTVAHSRTKDIKSHTRQADILVAAIGKAEFVTADMVKEGAVVIDVGINRVDDDSKKNGYRLTGDVKYDEVASKCSYITPVPGGVGPMTIAYLLNNTMIAARKRVMST